MGHQFNYDFKYVDPRLDIGSVVMAPYQISSIAVSKRARSGLKIKLVVNNIFDKQYAVIKDYSTLGRNYLIKLSKEI